MPIDRPKRTPCRLNRRSLVELSFASVAAGLTSSSFVLAAHQIADVGDLLGFAGAFVGAVMTIGGAIWVERHRFDRVEEGDRLFIIDCVRRTEKLASLITLWVKEFEDETFDDANSTAISLLIQIRSAFAEAVIIQKSIQQDALVKSKWSVRAIVNLNWLRDRAEEGLKSADDPSFSWKALIDEPSAVRAYAQSVHAAGTTMLVLSWRLLLILGERPAEADQGKYAIDSADVVYRHEAGMDF
ncbi:hypothetical protein [Sphingomonas sp. GB1N7]|uniref:hypothetical protein n=1 Tax=Parasphingomonas caseinilytica TaxID=3096158 RepID=UPI002FCB96EA